MGWRWQKLIFYDGKTMDIDTTIDMSFDYEYAFMNIKLAGYIWNVDKYESM